MHKNSVTAHPSWKAGVLQDHSNPIKKTGAPSQGRRRKMAYMDWLWHGLEQLFSYRSAARHTIYSSSSLWT